MGPPGRAGGSGGSSPRASTAQPGRAVCRIGEQLVPAFRPAPLQPRGTVHCGTAQHHHHERVVLELRLPPQRIARGEHPLGQQRQHRDHHRRGERQEAEGREQPDHGPGLHPRGDEHAQRVQRMGDHAYQRAAQRGPELVVRPVEGGRPAERRDQQVGSRPGRGQPAHDKGQAGPTAPGQQQVAAEARDEQAHVLLDQQQRHGGEDSVPAPPGVEPLHHHRGQHRDERDLVEVEDDGFHDRQRQGVGDTYEVGGPRAELAPGVGPQRRDGQREQHPLGHQQGGRAVVDPVQRGEQREDRRPVVGQQQEVCADPVGHAARDRGGRLEVRVPADPLVEDDQVERAGQEAPEQDERIQAVDQGGRRGQRPHLDPAVAPELPEPSGMPAVPSAVPGAVAALAGREPAA